MTSIVERLRGPMPLYYAEEEAIRKEAADLIEKMRSALLWIDGTDPEVVAAAEEKFGFKLVEPRGPQ